MAEHLHISTSYCLPGGVAQKPVADGHITCRITLGWIFAPDGIVNEEAGELADKAFSSSNEAVPWVSKAARDQAIGEVERWPGLKDDLRARLIAHLKKSAYYEDLAQ